MRQAANMTPLESSIKIESPMQFARIVGGRPQIEFAWRLDGGGKRRLIGNPNKPMRKLHELFKQYLLVGIDAMGTDANYPLRRLPSSTAFVKGSNPHKNADKHRGNRYLYVTDIWNAYPSVDLERLALLIVFIKKYSNYGHDFSLRMLGQDRGVQDVLRDDDLYPEVHTFLQTFCGGIRGEGLAVGGPISPLLFNLYCEVFVDTYLRRICRWYDITFTRYADDLVFSRSKPIIGEIRTKLRECITGGGFAVNHRKSKILSRNMGTVFVTKVGLRNSLPTERQSSIAKIVFPKKKRRRLHGIIGSYLHQQMDWPEKVSGYVAEFVYYFKTVDEPTASDKKTFALCKEFETEWAKYRRSR